MPTPKERMIQVVRWYMCSFHAGRKSGVAKKPYNPILGEIFRCHWDVENISGGGGEPATAGASATIVNDGPVPWCRENQLCFIAEQVSHHPPGKIYLRKFIPFCFAKVRTVTNKQQT